MSKSLDKMLETETIIRWDETDDPATLWTASIPVRNEWRSLGYPVENRGGGWGCSVPASRISYKTLQKA